MVDCRWINFRSWHLVDAFRRDAWSWYLEGCDLLVPARLSVGHHRDDGMEVLIEGVETMEQADWLAQEGCDYFQGYYFSRPLKEDSLIDYLVTFKDTRKTI